MKASWKSIGSGKAALAFLSAWAVGAFGQARPNIVVYLSDDHSQRDASIYGAAPALRTPSMDLLAKEGMVFDNAFAATPACAPSRSALLTGLMPARNGAEANHTVPRSTGLYLTKRLQAAGYRVAAFGKVADGGSPPEKGFDHWVDVPRRGDLSGAASKYWSGLADKTNPVCLMLGDHRPHVSWIPTPAYATGAVPLPPTLIDTKETREHWARYLTEVTGMDAELGRAYAWAKATFGNNLIFVYSSDHGAQWPFAKWNLYDAGIKVPLIVAAPGRVGTGLRNQAMVSWIDLLPTLFDFAGVALPADLDGTSFRAVLEGKAARHRDRIFTTHSGDVDRNVFPIRSVRTAGFKYILNPHPQYYHSNHSDIDRLDGAGAYWDSWDAAAARDSAAAAIRYRYYIRPKEEFYSLGEDPFERHNLIGAPAHAARIQEMRKQVADWMAAQGDTATLFSKPYPINGPRPGNIDTILPWRAPTALRQGPAPAPARARPSRRGRIPVRADGRSKTQGASCNCFSRF